MYGYIAYDAVERRGQMVISELSLLRSEGSFRGIPIGFGILKRLHCIIVVLLAGYFALVETFLAFQFPLVVVEDRLLLFNSAALLVD